MTENHIQRTKLFIVEKRSLDEEMVTKMILLWHREEPHEAPFVAYESIQTYYIK